MGWSQYPKNRRTCNHDCSCMQTTLPTIRRQVTGLMLGHALGSAGTSDKHACKWLPSCQIQPISANVLAKKRLGAVLVCVSRAGWAELVGGDSSYTIAPEPESMSVGMPCLYTRVCLRNRGLFWSAGCCHGTVIRQWRGHHFTRCCGMSQDNQTKARTETLGA